MPLFDWKCSKHGIFESSHPICPAMGCDHKEVEKIFIKAPSIRSNVTKNTDSGLRNLADSYGMSDMNNRGGKAVKGNSFNTGTHWGFDGVGGLDNMKSMARASAGESGFASTARAMGLDRRAVPPANTTISSNDVNDRAKVIKNSQ